VPAIADVEASAHRQFELSSNLVKFLFIVQLEVHNLAIAWSVHVCVYDEAEPKYEKANGNNTADQRLSCGQCKPRYAEREIHAYSASTEICALGTLNPRLFAIFAFDHLFSLNSSNATQNLGV
jgi:hypothetical protein